MKQSQTRGHFRNYSKTPLFASYKFDHLALLLVFQITNVRAELIREIKERHDYKSIFSQFFACSKSQPETGVKIVLKWETRNGSAGGGDTERVVLEWETRNG